MPRKPKTPTRDPKTGRFKPKKKRARKAPQTDWTGPDLFDMQRNAAGMFVSGRKLRAFEYDDAMQIIGMSDRWQKELEDLDEVLATWEQLAAVDNTGFAEWIKAQRLELRQLEREALQMQDRGQTKDAYLEEVGSEDGPMFYNSVNVDALDVTGLEGREASTLALLLKQWNPQARKVYVRRQGRRFLSKEIRLIDLNHPVVKGLAGRDDVLAVAKETGERFVYEDLQPTAIKTKRLTNAEISRRARLRKQAQNEQTGLGMTTPYRLGGMTQDELGI